MESDVFHAILRRLNERKSQIEVGLATGGAPNYENYCRLVGEYTALCDMEADVKELEKRYVEL